MTRLSKLGELGLLAELEQRGLIVDVENDAAQLADDDLRELTQTLEKAGIQV